MSSTPNTAVLAALVDDDTPTSLEYGDYRGWVLIDADTGEWVCDVTEEQVGTMTLGPRLYSEEYGVLRAVLS